MLSLFFNHFKCESWFVIISDFMDLVLVCICKGYDIKTWRRLENVLTVYVEAKNKSIYVYQCKLLSSKRIKDSLRHTGNFRFERSRFA